jgi:hypothetical protein
MFKICNITDSGTNVKLILAWSHYSIGLWATCKMTFAILTSVMEPKTKMSTILKSLTSKILAQPLDFPLYMVQNPIYAARISTGVENVFSF